MNKDGIFKNEEMKVLKIYLSLFFIIFLYTILPTNLLYL